MCTRLHSRGRLKAPPGASLDTPTQKNPGNGLPSAPPVLVASSTEKPLGLPPSGPKCFEGSWVIGGGALPS